MSSEPFIHQVALYEYQKMFPEKRLICILKNSNESKQYEFIVNLNTSPVCLCVFMLDRNVTEGMLSANINAMLFCVVCLFVKFKRNSDVKTKTFMFTTFYVWE